ncbi:hypothetical protein Pmani_032887 [Petrolisthes manimaculis]|uniref:Uncharacterized protein n=1 Tax=Petrolisthes manimaculis TaxID=1843537 RepID=A0AAE1TR68_9EUCA|nr:hypothetical protein Pmani_032887 [Petrolisthes manimaculis]
MRVRGLRCRQTRGTHQAALLHCGRCSRLPGGGRRKAQVGMVGDTYIIMGSTQNRKNIRRIIKCVYLEKAAKGGKGKGSAGKRRHRKKKQDKRWGETHGRRTVKQAARQPGRWKGKTEREEVRVRIDTVSVRESEGKVDSEWDGVEGKRSGDKIRKGKGGEVR